MVLEISRLWLMTLACFSGMQMVKQEAGFTVLQTIHAGMTGTAICDE